MPGAQRMKQAGPRGVPSIPPQGHKTHEPRDSKRDPEPALVIALSIFTGCEQSGNALSICYLENLFLPCGDKDGWDVWPCGLSKP